MQCDAATRLLHDYVPLLAHIGLEVTAIEAETVRLRAPLAANGNHHGTAFGGSLSLLGIVAGWLLAYTGPEPERRTRNIVVADSQIRFLRPLQQDPQAEARWSAAAADAYCAALAEGRRAEVSIDIVLGSGARTAARQRNRYVAEPA